MLPEGALTGHFRRTRPLGRNGECVTELMNDYVRQLLDSGFEADTARPYGHGSFENGEAITHHMRRSYRAAFLAGGPGIPRDPWAHAGEDFFAWYDRREDAASHVGKQSE